MGELLSSMPELYKWDDVVKGRMPAAAGARVEAERDDTRESSDAVALEFV